MARFSVWNNGTRRYDYYQAQGDAKIHAGAPPRSSTGELGATPEQAAWPLPADATRVGSGEMPEGRIASTEAGGSGWGIPRPIIYGVIGYVIWRMIK